MATTSLSKEKIKARMVKSIARIWDTENTDVEVSFDPIVSMLLEGCVNEFEKLNHEIANTQYRVIGRIAELLTPDIITSPVPASAIVFAKPIEPETVIYPELQFYYSKKSSQAGQQEMTKDIFFSPLSSFKIVDGSVRLLAFANGIFEVQNGYQKMLLSESLPGQRLENSTMWVGLELNGALSSLSDLVFYFEVRNNEESFVFYNLLSQAIWQLEDQVLPTRIGWEGKEDARQSLDEEYDLEKRSINEIKNLYQRNFVSISSYENPGSNIAGLKCSYPIEFSNVFNKNDLQKLKNDTLWIKIKFPPAIEDSLLADVFCNINCFPVVNKKLNEFTFRLQPNLNIVPLTTNDYFLIVRKVYSSDKFQYSSNPLSNTENYNSGTYTLRQGGIQRFDSRNAKEIIQYLIDLLRDESASFTILGNEFLSNQLKQFNQLIALLEQKSGKIPEHQESTAYLVINPRQAGETVFVSFWSTNGEIANHIRSGNKLQLYGGGDVRNESIVLVTNSKGGRNRLDDAEKLNAFKHSLVTRGRVVTANDIKLFCLKELGKSVSHISIRKGFMNAADSKTGFVQTIDVLLEIDDPNNNDGSHLSLVCRDLEDKLNSNSSFFTPIHVRLTNPQPRSKTDSKVR
jgi:hypothetical protein